MARLMDFMYTGATEARQDELPEFLTTATKLQIRGFGFRRLTDQENDQKKAFNGCFDEEKFPKFSARKKICGRKSSVPKKLKLPENKITVSTDKQEKHLLERKEEWHPYGAIKTGKVSSTGKPMIKCEECGKVLADPSSLYRHRKIHTGEKPHTCPFCHK